MMKKLCVALLSGLFVYLPQFLFPQNSPGSNSAQARTFSEIFPNLAAEYRNDVFTDGVIRSAGKDGGFELIPSITAGINFRDRLRIKGFPYISESLLVVPYRNRRLSVLDSYNALRNIRNMKGLLYSSYTRNEEVPLFEDATRMESERRNNPIPDPPPASVLPSEETVYMRLKDANFGNSYYRAEITPYGRGLLLYITNYKTITYLIFTVMKEENFSAYLYMEPLEDGMLVYSVAGTDVSDFIASQVSIPSAISKRLGVFVMWIRNGILEQ